MSNIIAFGALLEWVFNCLSCLSNDSDIELLDGFNLDVRNKIFWQFFFLEHLGRALIHYSSELAFDAFLNVMHRLCTPSYLAHYVPTWSFSCKVSSCLILHRPHTVLTHYTLQPNCQKCFTRNSSDRKL